MPFWNKRKLIDRDPKTIDLINLTILEKSLMAKLLLVNNELIKRYTKLIEASLGMPEMEQAAKTFADGVARRIKLNFALEDELARVLEPEKTAQTSN